MAVHTKTFNLINDFLIIITDIAARLSDSANCFEQWLWCGGLSGHDACNGGGESGRVLVVDSKKFVCPEANLTIEVWNDTRAYTIVTGEK
jgi:hypothetical protein